MVWDFGQKDRKRLRDRIKKLRDRQRPTDRQT